MRIASLHEFYEQRVRSSGGHIDCIGLHWLVWAPCIRSTYGFE